jgi:serine/threonine protein phosphatase PrpC
MASTRRTSSSTNIGDRPQNEDCYTIHKLDDDCMLLVLADGHGGRQVAENSVRLVVDRARLLCPGIISSHGRCDVPTQKREFARLFEAADTFDVSQHVGSTLVVAMVFAHCVCVASCGDSQAVMYDVSGEVVGLTEMHRPSDAKELRRVEAAGAHFDGVYVMHGDAGLAMTRAIGDHHAPFAIATPDAYRFELPEDGFVLALFSDGLSDAFDLREVGQLVTPPAQNLYEQTRNVVTAAVARRTGVSDNTSLILCACSKAE